MKVLSTDVSTLRDRIGRTVVALMGIGGVGAGAAYAFGLLNHPSSRVEAVILGLALVACSINLLMLASRKTSSSSPPDKDSP